MAKVCNFRGREESSCRFLPVDNKAVRKHPRLAVIEKNIEDETEVPGDIPQNTGIDSSSNLVSIEKARRCTIQRYNNHLWMRVATQRTETYRQSRRYSDYLSIPSEVQLCVVGSFLGAVGVATGFSRDMADSSGIQC